MTAIIIWAALVIVALGCAAVIVWALRPLIPWRRLADSRLGCPDAPVDCWPAYLPAPAPREDESATEWLARARRPRTPTLPNPVTPAAVPPRQPAPAPSPISPGEGATPGGYAPRHAATQPRLVLAPLWDGLVEVTDGTGPRAVIWPQAKPSTRTTGTLPALGDLPPVPVRRCSTDVAAFGDSLIAGLRAL